MRLWREGLSLTAARLDDFAQALLYFRNRTFDNIPKSDPALVRFAREGDVAMVKALVQCGASL